MADVSIKYKGSVKAELNASGTKTVKTAGKYCEGDIEVIYTDPEKPTQSKTVTPTAAGFTVTPDSGKVLSSVKVNGDADLVPGNVKNGVNIFGVTGTLNEGISPTKDNTRQTKDEVQTYIDYITSHPYSPDDYTSSYFESYTTGWNINTYNYANNPQRPVGFEIPATSGTVEFGGFKQTLSAQNHKIYNLIPNAETPYTVYDSNGNVTHTGVLKPTQALRQIMATTDNFRDLGGWACDGGTVKYGILFRSGEPSANDADIVKNQLGIKTELDLTGDGVPGAISGLEHKGYVGAYAIYALTPVDVWRFNIKAIFDAAKYNKPLLFHCSAGADRTGTLACIIEGILGVSQSNIDVDYELSFFSPTNWRTRTHSRQGETSSAASYAKLITAIKALSGSTFRDKCVNFVASLGFTAEEINDFRSAMINGTPATVTPSVGTVTITNTLTNATTNNAASSLTKYQPYKAVITPNDGYKIDENTVNVTMGGNVTNASAIVKTFPNNEVVIDIPVATDNISITLSAVATEKPNLFVKTPSKTATSTATFDDVVSIGARINSGGKEVYAGLNMLATRYISASVGDTFVVKSDMPNDTNPTYTGMIAFYRSDGTYLNQILKSAANWSWSADKKEGTITIPSTYGGVDMSPCAKARFVVAYSDMDNIIINKN